MKQYFLFLALFLPLLTSAQAGKLKKADQEQIATKVLELNALAYTMQTDTNGDHRFQACKDLIIGLVEVLKLPNSYNYDFADLKGVKVLPAPDNQFRIFSWELFLDRDDYRHYGALQKNSKKLDLVPLVDRGDWLAENPENARMTADKWLGYIAYQIVPGGTFEGTPYYFLFGYDRYGTYRRRKILDVLHFDGFGKPNFGLPVFMTYNEKDLLLTDRKRLILEYSARANVVLEHDPTTDRIVYENLILTPSNGGDGPINMPDGSYHALEYREGDGMWHEVEKVYEHTYEKAPRDSTKRPARLDILGRPRGG